MAGDVKLKQGRRTEEAETRLRLLRYVRCVMFAALEAGLSEDDLEDALATAVDADARRREAEEIPGPRVELSVVR